MSKQLRVLLVEDTPDDRKLIVEMLDEAGDVSFDVEFADSLAGALDRFQNDSFAAVLLDLDLPDSEGLATFLKTKNLVEQTPIVVLTDLHNESLGLRIISDGGQDFLAKTNIDANALIRAVRYAIERTDLQARLRASERRYRSLVDASGEAIMSVTCDAKVQTWNRAAERIFGYNAEEMNGVSISRLVPEDRAGEVDELYARLRNGQAVVGFETRRRTKNGRLVDIVLNLQPIVDDAGNVTGAVGTACDVTTSKQAQAQLRRRDAELAHISRLTTMGEMVAALAHELTQPLGAAANYAGACTQLIESGNTSPTDLLDSLRQLTEQIDRMSEVIHRLRSFVTRTAPKKRRVDLNDLVRDVDKLLPVEGPDRQITRKADLDPNLPKAWADPVQIEQVLVNLVRNAQDAVADVPQSRREIVIRTSLSEGTPVVSVTDHGKGIAANQIDRVFEPFFTTKRDGLGMGLSISRTIIQNHCGRLWAEPNPDNGASFFFTLPSAEQ